mmetsp:Transcript_105587/g.251644  ORF Transcript_105587/g.251644 Transcript_105587/m.251644 type:complete len:271 (+) Transcript_105587:2458-3270(+)
MASCHSKTPRMACHTRCSESQLHDFECKCPRSAVNSTPTTRPKRNPVVRSSRIRAGLGTARYPPIRQHSPSPRMPLPAGSLAGCPSSSATASGSGFQLRSPQCRLTRTPSHSTHTSIGVVHTLGGTFSSAWFQMLGIRRRRTQAVTEWSVIDMSGHHTWCNFPRLSSPYTCSPPLRHTRLQRKDSSASARPCRDTKIHRRLPKPLDFGTFGHHRRSQNTRTNRTSHRPSIHLALEQHRSRLAVEDNAPFPKGWWPAPRSRMAPHRSLGEP